MKEMQAWLTLVFLKSLIAFDNYDDFFSLHMDTCFIWPISANRKRYVIRDNCLAE